MTALSFADTLAHLMRRLGEHVSVKLGSVTSEGPPVAVEMAGTLTTGWDTSTEGVGALEDIAIFGFAEHSSTFNIDHEFFRAAWTDATGAWLSVDLTTLGIEISPHDRRERV